MVEGIVNVNNEPLTDEELFMMKEAALYEDGFLGSGPIGEFQKKLMSNDMLICKTNVFANGYDFYLNGEAMAFLVNLETFKKDL